MDFLIEWFPLILNGLITTVELTLFGIFTGLVIGIVLAISDLYGGRFVSKFIWAYVEFFRGSPIIAQLYIFIYAIPGILNIRLPPLAVGFMVFALNSAAYQKGYIKGAMEAVFEDQMLAGLSIGMTRLQTTIHVILPQALRIVIPAWSNEFCSLTKSTSAILVLGVTDLTSAGWAIGGLTYRFLETYIFIAAIYLVWITAVTKIADIVYEKKKIPGIEISA